MEEIVQAVYHANLTEKTLNDESSRVSKIGFRKPTSLLNQLTQRELQIMFMICHGAKVKDIAQKLFLGIKTVNRYRYRLFEKLNVQNDVELTHLAIRHGILDIDFFADEHQFEIREAIP